MLNTNFESQSAITSNRKCLTLLKRKFGVKFLQPMLNFKEGAQVQIIINNNNNNMDTVVSSCPRGCIDCVQKLANLSIITINLKHKLLYIARSQIICVCDPDGSYSGAVSNPSLNAAATAGATNHEVSLVGT